MTSCSDGWLGDVVEYCNEVHPTELIAGLCGKY